jgi:RNA polymerase sigma-70 factor (ECF subfamily)
METLSPDQRAVFVLRTFEELSYQEIAEALGLSMGTVMSRLSRARERLRQAVLPYLARSGRPSEAEGA